MYFTSGQDRAFRPDWKYQYCVYAGCPYQPGKLTALAAVKFTVKGADDDVAVFRVEKNITSTSFCWPSMKSTIPQQKWSRKSL